MVSACGAVCSECAAFHGRDGGRALQREAAAAWKRIYGFAARPEQMHCGGCLGPEDEIFHTSRTCKARRCCLDKGLGGCGECDQVSCELLARAQAVWDGVPAIAATLSAADRARYAAPYIGVRERIAAARDRGHEPTDTRGEA